MPIATAACAAVDRGRQGAGGDAKVGYERWPLGPHTGSYSGASYLKVLRIRFKSRAMAASDASDAAPSDAAAAR